jgi:peroxiredoxin
MLDEMKKPATIFVFVFTLLFFGCAGPSSKTQESEQAAVPSTNDLPNMLITTLDQSKVNIHELSGKIILILFQPDCDHCQREAKEIRENLDAFEGYSLYFISADPVVAIEKFGREYDLLGHSNIYLAETTVENVINNFGSIPAPSVYIYSGQLLVQKFNGEVPIQKILNAI